MPPDTLLGHAFFSMPANEPPWFDTGLDLRAGEHVTVLAKNTLENHDYLSIAVEFDNGQDLAFFWSSQLPVDTGFRCPIPTWTARETHAVTRSGNDLLGRWMDEERPLHTCYERFVGTIGKRDDGHDPRVVPPPTRIERIWLIANSMFKRRKGAANTVPSSCKPTGRSVA